MDDELPPTPKTDAERQLQALTQQLEQVQAGTAQPAGGKAPGRPAADATIFGYTPGALFLGLVLSTVAIGYLRYAKVTSDLSHLIVGLALLAMTYFIRDAWILLACSAGVIGLSLLVRRFVRF